jgi:hypothetical protein
MGHRIACVQGDSVQEELDELQQRSMSLHIYMYVGLYTPNPTNHKPLGSGKKCFMGKSPQVT